MGMMDKDGQDPFQQIKWAEKMEMGRDAADDMHMDKIYMIRSGKEDGMCQQDEMKKCWYRWKPVGSPCLPQLSRAQFAANEVYLESRLWCKAS